MKLVFYSGGDNKQNEELDLELIKLVGNDNFKMTYIPSSGEGSERYYQEVLDYYHKYGITNILHFPIDKPFSLKDLEVAFERDVIYLSGGNTYYFLKHLKEANLLPKLEEFVKRGGVLLGVSAGSIIMTPKIDISGIPFWDCDENFIKLKNLNSLNLVNFEFSPHYVEDKKLDEELVKYSLGLNYPLYTCGDGSGVVVSGDNTSFVGTVYNFFQGEKIQVEAMSQLQKIH